MYNYMHITSNITHTMLGINHHSHRIRPTSCLGPKLCVDKSSRAISVTSRLISDSATFFQRFHSRAGTYIYLMDLFGKIFGPSS